MLLPSYIFLRPWYANEVQEPSLDKEEDEEEDDEEEGTSVHKHVLFLCPHERYSFEAVEDAESRTTQEAKHVPFVTMVR